eukprot:4566387-Alexandrium_andersonii.AAC.1
MRPQQIPPCRLQPYANSAASRAGPLARVAFDEAPTTLQCFADAEEHACVCWLSDASLGPVCAA